jgi:ABC-2 type transport system permease protein
VSRAASTRAAMKAMPTLLRVGVAETVAYRAEFVVWMMTTTLPLVMLALWTSVAAEAPFEQFGHDDFIAYYLAALIVRQVTGSWVVWQINEEVRTGTLSMRLLRPIHPFVGYTATHLSAIPLRGLVALPFAVLLLFTAGRGSLTGDPVMWLLVVPSLAGAWVLTFFTLVLLGALGLFIERSLAIFDVYLGVFAVLSGYLLPLALLPDWAAGVARATPFRFMLSFPIELSMGSVDGRGQALALLGLQWAYALAVLALAARVWRAGVRRYEAYGA